MKNKWDDLGHFKNVNLSATFPWMWSRYGDDGFGGPPVIEPGSIKLIVWDSVPEKANAIPAADGYAVYAMTSITELVDDYIDACACQDGLIGEDQEAIVEADALVTALRSAADRLEAKIRSGKREEPTK